MVTGSKTVPAGGHSYIQINSESQTEIHYRGAGFTQFNVPLTINCPGEEPFEATNGSLFWLWTGDDDNEQVSSDPELLKGDFATHTDPDIDATYQWHFARSKETP